MNLHRGITVERCLFCCLTFLQAPQNYSHTQRNPHVYYRHEVINQLQETNQLVSIVADNLASYMNKVYALIEGKEIAITIIYDRYPGKFWCKMWFEWKVWS